MKKYEPLTIMIFAVVIIVFFYMKLMHLIVAKVLHVDVLVLNLIYVWLDEVIIIAAPLFMFIYSIVIYRRKEGYKIPKIIIVVACSLYFSYTLFTDILPLTLDTYEYYRSNKANTKEVIIEKTDNKQTRGSYIQIKGENRPYYTRVRVNNEDFSKGSKINIWYLPRTGKIIGYSVPREKLNN